MQTDYDIANAITLAPVQFADTPDAGAPPEELLLIRYGESQYTKGETRGSFSFSEADADEILDDYAKRGKDIVFDYEHQTLKGGEAPASGWIRQLSKGEQGLMAKVEWTKKAENYLRNREYRYHSPVLFFTKDRPSRLHSVALTNHPAFHGYPALVADDSNPKTETKMNEHLKAIAEVLGVTLLALADGKEDEKGTAEAVLGKIKELIAAGKAQTEFLALHDCKSHDELTLKIKGMVPAAEKQQLEEKLAGIEAEKAVAKAFSDGKLIEAQREWAVALAKKDLKAFNDYAEKAPVIAPGPAATVPTGDAPKADDKQPKVFTDEEKAIFKALSLTDEQIKKIQEDKL